MNIYLEIIKSLSYENKYLRWYTNIIENSIKRMNLNGEQKKDGYFERHHIVPESFFIKRKRKGVIGFLEGDPENNENITLLTPKEHIYCHTFLVKMIKCEIGKDKCVYALNKMLIDEYGEYISRKIYGLIKEEFSKLISKKMRIKMSNPENNPFTGLVPVIDKKGNRKLIEKYIYENQKCEFEKDMEFVNPQSKEGLRRTNTLHSTVKIHNIINIQTGEEYFCVGREEIEKFCSTRGISYASIRYASKSSLWKKHSFRKFEFFRNEELLRKITKSNCSENLETLLNNKKETNK